MPLPVPPFLAFYDCSRNCVPKDMGHVGGVAAEAFEFINHVQMYIQFLYSFSIYNKIDLAAWRSMRVVVSCKPSWAGLVRAARRII